MSSPSSTLGPYTTRRTPKGPLGQEIDPFGVAGATVGPKVQSDVFKELINKLAWVLGSTYAMGYTHKDTHLKDYARMCAHAILRDHGYPTR